jgi:hypothetical protein
MELGNGRPIDEPSFRIGRFFATPVLDSGNKETEYKAFDWSRFVVSYGNRFAGVWSSSLDLKDTNRDLTRPLELPARW